MNKTSHNITRLLILSVATLLLIGAYSFVFYTIRAKGIHTESLLSDIESEQKKIDDSTSLKKTIQTVHDEEEELRSHFVHADDIIPFLEFFEGFGRQNSKDFMVTSVDTNMENHPKLIVSFSAHGTFTQMHTLLGLIENMPYQITLSSISLVLASDPAVSGVVPTWELSGVFSVDSFITQ